MLRRLLLATLASLALPAAALAAPADNGRPLVYVFSLDGLDGDLVDDGAAPNLSALLAGQGARATLFQESRSIFVAETNPNHTAMATGAYGDTSGIPGNEFALYGQPVAEPEEPSLGADTGVPAGDSCVIPGGPDETKPPVTTSGESAGCLTAETFFQTVEARADRDELVTAGIFGKPKLARIFSGRRLDPRRYDADYLWTPCAPLPGSGDSPPYCEAGVPARPTDSYALDDSDVMDEVLRTVREGVRGDGRTFTRPTTGAATRPNLTFVNFPAIDSAGHLTGASAVYRQMVADVDADLKRFVDQQKALGLWERTTIVVLSDHAMETTVMKTTLGTRFAGNGPDGSYEIVQNGSAALVYLTNRSAPKAERDALLRDLRAAALAGNLAGGPPAAEALYREPNALDGGDEHTVAKVHPAYRIAGARTGDLIVNAAPDAAFNEGAVGNPLQGNHGGGQTRDNLLAILGGSPAIRQGRVTGIRKAPLFDDTLLNPDQAENVDVAPTVLRLLSRPAPAQSQGRFLEQAFDLAQVPPPVPATGTPTPGTGATPAPALLRLLDRRFRVREGRITLRLMCAGRAGQRCSRTVRVLRDGRTIARRAVALRAGTSLRLRVRLDARSRRSLARGTALRATILGKRVTVVRTVK